MNARYGFALLRPQDFRADPPPVNGDGRSFTSPDGTVTVNGSGRLLERQGDMAAELGQALGGETQGGLQLTDKVLTRTGFTYSGVSEGRVVFVRAIPVRSGAAVVSLTVTYPASAKVAMDGAVTAMAGSLHATRGCL